MTLSHPIISAVGDIHGRFDCLIEVLAHLNEISRVSDPRPHHIIFLGDYMDRGPKSADVMSRLRQGPLPNNQSWFFLRGNHEILFLDALSAGPGSLEWRLWLLNGGRETLSSFGISPLAFSTTEELEQVRDWVVRLTLPYYADVRSMYFVHAGMYPGVPIEDQEDHDLYRERLPDSDDLSGWDRLLVHGHTPRRDPFLGAYAFNLDTGAYATGKLTAATWMDPTLPRQVSIFSSSQPQEPRWFVNR